MKSASLLIALVASRAYAGHGGGSCSHGGGGGHSSSSSSSSGGGESSSSSSSSSDSSTTTSEASHGCTESTDLEGYRECTKFGAWADNMILPHILVELGTNVRRFETSVGGAGGSVTHGDETFVYRVAMPASARRAEVAVTTSARLAIGLGHGFYAGLEGEIGGLPAPVSVTAEMLSTGTYGSPQLDLSGGMFLGGYGIAGLRGGTSRVALAAELAGGVRTVEYRFDSSYHDCQQTSTIDMTRGVIEARARAEIWVYPWVSTGVTAGTSVLDHGDWMAGLYIGLHSRAYGGLR